MSFIASIETKLREALAPTHLEIINESHKHAGHHHHEHGKETYFDGGGETHLRIRIVSSGFSGKSRVDRHRAVNALISEEIAAGLHAVAIEAAAPEETR